MARNLDWGFNGPAGVLKMWHACGVENLPGTQSTTPTPVNSHTDLHPSNYYITSSIRLLYWLRHYNFTIIWIVQFGNKTANIKRKKTYQFTILCKGDYVTHPKQHKSFYWYNLIKQIDCPYRTNWLPLQNNSMLPHCPALLSFCSVTHCYC